jgi:hypothetical protein
MRISNNVTPSNGIILVTLVAQFVGDPTDPTDKQKIAAFGDPIVNLAGKLLIDPNNPSFTFGFQTNELNVGLTTQMQNYTARFLTSLPPVGSLPPGQPQSPNWFEHNRHRDHCEQNVPTLGLMDCIVADEAAQNEAAVAWVATMVLRIQAAMAILRGQTVIPSIPGTTV